MPAPKLDELLALDVETKLSVISTLWDSIVDQQEQLPISEREKALVAKWEKEDAEDPEPPIPWEVVRKELLNE